MADELLRLAVQDALAGAWKANVALAADETADFSERTHLHRFHVHSTPGPFPSNVIVKQPRGNGARDTVAFFNEWASLQLLTELGGEPVAPRLFCGDATGRFLVMEDLGTEGRFDRDLLGNDPVRATDTFLALFATLGRLHAMTAGKRSRFETILNELVCPREPGEIRYRPLRRAPIEDALARLSLQPDPRFFDELAVIENRLAAPGGFDVLNHGDPCPDNCHRAGNHVRIVDFEHGRFADAFTDGCYASIHFPTCWCVSQLPQHTVAQAVATYRRELAKAIPQAADDALFDRGMTDAAIRWIWSTFANRYMPDILEHDAMWGLVSVRQRVLFRFQLLVEMLERTNLYAAIADVTRTTRAALVIRWDGVSDMPFYPAFSNQNLRQ